MGDFGLSKVLELNKNDYRFSKFEKLPVKWMAPGAVDRSSEMTDYMSFFSLTEALQHGTFSHKSDVWSYGMKRKRVGLAFNKLVPKRRSHFMGDLVIRSNALGRHLQNGSCCYFGIRSTTRTTDQCVLGEVLL